MTEHNFGDAHASGPQPWRLGGPQRPPSARGPAAGPGPRGFSSPKPPLRIQTTTLWEYPSQHYPGGKRPTQGDSKYIGATPSWVIWQLLSRYTRPGDVVVDPMCGSGTTLDVCDDLDRKGLGFDLQPQRPQIKLADAREIPIADHSADFVFIDPPYSTHVDYSDDPRCIGLLDAAGEDAGEAYYASMAQVIGEIDRILRPRRYMALYVSDSYRKKRGVSESSLADSPSGLAGSFMPIGFELFAILRQHFAPVDIISVVRHNQKLEKGNFHKAAEEGNFFLRGFNYLFIMKKLEVAPQRPRPTGGGSSKRSKAPRRRD